MYVDGLWSIVNGNECDFVSMEERKKIYLANTLGIGSKENLLKILAYEIVKDPKTLGA